MAAMRRRMYHSNLHDLFFSLIHGGLSALDKYIVNGGSVKITGPDRKSLLTGAIIEQQENVFHRCLELGFDLEAADDSGKTALHWAASEGLAAYVRALVDHGANVDRTDNGGNSALILAAQNNHVDTVQMLVLAGVNVNIQNNDGYTALHYCTLKMHVEVMEVLLNSGCNTFLRTSSDSRPCSPISFSLYNKDLRSVQKILDHNGRWCEGSLYSPDLLIAVDRKYFDAVQMLLAYGIDPFPIDDHSTWNEILTSGSSRRLRESLISEYGYFTTSGSENKLLMGILKKHQFLNYFNLLKLMFGYGLQIHGVLSRSSCKEKCMCRKVLWDLHNMAGCQPPGTLQQLCRNSIRASLRFGVVKKVTSLRLPPKLKRYLCMSGEFCLEKSLI